MILTDSSTLAEAIFATPSLIPVINRFGILLGVGDASVAEVCRRHDIDTEFFLAIVNTFLNDDYFPDTLSGALPLGKVLEYLHLTDRYYAEVQLPNIERHFQALLHSSPEKNNLPLLQRFFLEMKSELLSCIEFDNLTAFPLIRSILSYGKATAGMSESLPDSLARRGVVEKVDDLSAFFVIHLKGDYNRNLCMAVVSAVFHLSRDIRQNNRIRERILSPALQSLMDSKSSFS